MEIANPQTSVVETGSISGRVLFSNSDNHSNILVSLEQTDGLRSLYTDSRALAGSTSTDQDGNYSFSDVEPGVYTIYATHNSSLEKAAVSRNIVVTAGRSLTLEDLNLTATATISGRIKIDDKVTGNLGITVFIAGTSYIAITDDYGYFKISGVPIGESYMIAVMKGSYTAVISYSEYLSSTFGMTLDTYDINSTELAGQGSLIWKGSSSTAPVNPEINWAYFNTLDGSSYIYNGSTWELLARAGQDGASITWLGSLDTPPENPKKLNAYFNTQTGCSYIFDGRNWTLLAQVGKEGAVGADGKSIKWLGSFDTAPENPSSLDAYYNILDGSSYIYTGTEWNLLAKGMAHEHTYVSQWKQNETYHWHESSCGHTYAKGDMAEHEWNSGSVIEAASCTKTGIVNYKCITCSCERQGVIEKTTHQYSLTSTTEPTCTDDGVSVQTCSNCGDEIRTAVLALGHDYGTDNVCDNCGFIKEDSHAHSYTEEVIAPTCTEMGYTNYTCSICSDSYKDNLIEQLGHSWDEGSVTTAKTCTADGIITYTCNREGCSETREETIPHGHEYEYTVIIPATCTTSGLRGAVCTVCGSTLSEDPIPASHTWNEGDVISEAGCTTDGSVLYKCTICGEENVVVTKATGHRYNNGVCELCGRRFIDDVVQDIDYPQYGMYFRIEDIKSAYGDKTINTYGVYLDHNENAEITKVGVYLTQDGTMWRRSLAFKGTNITSAYYVPFLSYDKDIYYTGLNTASINTFKLSKNADGIYTYGNYTTIGVNLTDSTGRLLLTMSHVGQAGAKTKVFTNLNEMIAWLNEGEHTHSYGEWTVIKAPTCTEYGKKERTCSYADCSEKQTELIAAKGHTFGDWNVTVQPTCGEEGTRNRTCSVCSTVQTESVAATGHSFSTGWTYDATYHWHESTCGHNSVIAGKEEHSFSSWTVEKEATAEEHGLKTRSCTVCEYSEKQEIMFEGGVPYVSYTWDSVNNSLSSKLLSVSNYTDVTEDTTTWSDGCWYVVSSDVTINSRITVKGTVNVILCDGTTLTAENGIRLAEGNTLNIYGQNNESGSLVSKKSSSYSYSASIGGNSGEPCGNINVFGGQVTAASNSYGAGIGGGCDESGGTITIYGGTVNADGSSYGAGIGGGCEGSGGTITIYGGTVNANGGSYGAGIGGGCEGSGGTITIYGGIVNANGSYFGAGIGGGYDESGGTITISGGTVTATGGGSGAGIGGGSGGAGGTITISGGTVTATGGGSGAGIGAGYNNSDNGNLYIDAADMVCSNDEEVYFTGPGSIDVRYRYMRIYEHIHTEATKTEDGKKITYCSICNYVIKTESEIDIHIHTFKDYRCSGCGIWGQGPAGGYVFYDCDADNASGNADGLKSSECGWRFLEAAPYDLGDKYYFGLYRTSSSGSNLIVGTSTKIGTGKANTEALVKAMGTTTYYSTSGTSKQTYAAIACDNYSITNNGFVYDDWFLPSKEELNLIYLNLKSLDSFYSYWYWSSSEYSSTNGWDYNFSSGDQSGNGRSTTSYVRPVRAFK